MFGKALKLREELERRAVLLVFVPDLASPWAREVLAQLQAHVQAFDLAGVGLYAISPSPLTAAQDFVPRYHLLFPLIADSDRRIHGLYNVKAGGPRALLSSAGPAALRRAAVALKRGVGRPSRGLFSPVQAFVLGQDGRVHSHFSARSLFEELPLEDLLAKAQEP